MLGTARIEGVGHKAGIVDGRERDAVTGERHHIELGILHDFEHGLVFEDRLQKIERLAHGNLLDRVAAKIEPVRRSVGEGDISRVTRRDGERHANQLALHGIG
jgi:hypothetical protein